MYKFEVHCAAFSFIQMKRVISMSVKIEDTGRELIVARKLDDVSLNDQNQLSSQAETKSFAVIDKKR